MKVIAGVMPNDVVYVKRDGKIIAAKVTEYKYAYQNRKIYKYHDNYKRVESVVLHRADGVDEDLRLVDYTWLYHSIEDAINHRPLEIVDIDITNYLIAKYGFEYQKKDGCLTKRVYRWDTYNVKAVDLSCKYFIIRCTCNGLSVERKNGIIDYVDMSKFYETEEECRKDNHVDVITF
jgi:hypothetical protein